jgi:hypothetical protein
LGASVEVDLEVDLDRLDPGGIGVSALDKARAPELMVKGAWIVVGRDGAVAVAQVVGVQGDEVRVRPLPGPIGRASR